VKLQLTLTDLDRRIWEDELADFVPQRVFDAHTHVYDLREDISQCQGQLPPYPAIWMQHPVSELSMLDQADRLLFPDRQVRRISFGNPFQTCPLDQANAFTARAVSADPLSTALMLVRPDLSPEDLIDQARKYDFRGLKPYRKHALTGDPVEGRITDYLPECQIEAADRLGMMVMLHLSKSQAVADPENLADLERLTARFPKVKWVLAHCARSYYDRPLLRAGDRLGQIPNLWYDISSVCDADAMDVLLSIAGPDRVMYGSDDLAVGITRGKYITFGHAWAGLMEDNHNFDLSHCDGRMTFTRYESLRAFRRATRRHGYGQDEIEKLFFTNAQRLVDSTDTRQAEL